jgi:hypothetical protein
MPLATIGATGPQILGTSISFEPGVGQTRTVRVAADTAFALGTYLQTLGTNVSYDGELRDGGVIQITYPPDPGWTTQTALDTEAEAEADWELVPNIQTLDLRYFGTWGNDANVALAWNDYRAGRLYKTIPPDEPSINRSLDLGSYGTAGTVGYTFGSHLIKGTDTFEREAYVIRQTIHVGRESDLEASFTDVFQVVTPPTPNEYAKFAMTTLGSAYQWLKRPPSVRVVSKGFQISQEWWGAKEWSASLYIGGAGVP